MRAADSGVGGLDFQGGIFEDRRFRDGVKAELQLVRLDAGELADGEADLEILVARCLSANSSTFSTIAAAMENSCIRLLDREQGRGDLVDALAGFATGGDDLDVGFECVDVAG